MQKVGNREMYMNCAPINILGANAKRSAADQFESRLASKIAARQESSLNSLPDMFKANIGNGCSTLEGTDVEFPSPGASLELKQTPELTSLGKPVGSCGAAGPAPVVTPTEGTTEPSTGPGEFLEGGQEGPSPVQGDISEIAPTRAAEIKPVESAAAPSAPSPEPKHEAPAQPEQPAQPEAPAQQNETAPAPKIPTVGGSAIAPGTPCPADEGNWNCIDGTSFQRCASGQWSQVQAVAGGTTCASGISSSIKIVSMPAAKREVRFSTAHVRRHINARSF